MPAGGSLNRTTFRSSPALPEMPNFCSSLSEQFRHVDRSFIKIRRTNLPSNTSRYLLTSGRCFAFEQLVRPSLQFIGDI